MLTRSELEFKSRACLAQLKLRVVAFSIAIAVPAWIGFWVLQRLGWTVTHFARLVGLLLLGVYVVGVVRIVRRTQRDHGLVCPNCNARLGMELKGLTTEGKCADCGERLLKQ